MTVKAGIMVVERRREVKTALIMHKFEEDIRGL